MYVYNHYPSHLFLNFDKQSGICQVQNVIQLRRDTIRGFCPQSAIRRARAEMVRFGYICADRKNAQGKADNVEVLYARFFAYCRHPRGVYIERVEDQ
jgi:hypothetical protein